MSESEQEASPRKRRFGEEFKRDAVRLVAEEQYSFKAAAAAVGVSEQSLRAWHAKLVPPPAPCGESATLSEFRAEIVRLRKQLRRAELEREILKHGRPTSRRSRCEVRLDPPALRLVSHRRDVRRPGRLEVGLLRLDRARAEPAISAAAANRRRRAASPCRIARRVRQPQDRQGTGRARRPGSRLSQHGGPSDARIGPEEPGLEGFYADPTREPAPNTLDRDFTAVAPNQKWVTDITYLFTAQGWVYLAVVLDLFSRKVVGWAMSNSLATELVSEALRQAIESRRPVGKNLLHHSDRGCQYTSDAYQQTLRTLGIECSMSRTGECYDNAVMERFFWSLKHEWTKHEMFDDLEAARLSVFKYIETFYNPVRLHQTLGYKSPDQFEADHAPVLAA